MKQALTIAGSDSSGGAGIQADLKTMHAHGVYATCVITAVTAQNTAGIRHSHALPVATIEAQLAAVFDDFNIAAAKTGMLASPAIVGAVANQLGERRVPNLVVDPVMRASDGHTLLDDAAIGVMTATLFPLALCVTPNRSEAEALADTAIESLDDMKRAARRIREYGCHSVLVKGGHADFDPATDVLYDGREIRVFRAVPVARGNLHGTGCALSAAIAARLALGEPLATAILRAKSYLSGALDALPEIGGGRRPLNHFYFTAPYEPIE
jgi:hydroxymethylpyrimidine/phosphomethylpyrimidine kinase